MAKVVFKEPLDEEAQKVLDKKMRIIARVARMIEFRKQNPTAETDTFDDSIEDYKYLWRKVPKDERAGVVEAAHDLHDMTPELIAAAMAVLEPTNGSR